MWLTTIGRILIVFWGGWTSGRRRREARHVPQTDVGPGQPLRGRRRHRRTRPTGTTRCGFFLEFHRKGWLIFFLFFFLFFFSGAVAHPHGPEQGWRWLAAVLNLPPRADITATVLYHFLEVIGHSFLCVLFALKTSSVSTSIEKWRNSKL